MKKVASLFLGLFTLTGSFSGRAHAAAAPVCGRSGPVKAQLETLFKKGCESITESDLASLVRLDVSERKIERYHADDFTGLVNLEILNLRSNPAPELPEGLLRDLARLKTVVIIGAGLRHFPDDFLEHNLNIENLHLFDIRVRSISESVFSRLKNLTRLKVIDVDRTLNTAERARLSVMFPKGGPVALSFE